MPWTLITGSAKGLGRSCALQLASQGHDVIIHYRTSQKEAKDTAEECKKWGVNVEIVQGNLLDLLTLKDIYGLVNNVGQYLTKDLFHTSEDEWLEIFQKNVHAPFFLIKAYLSSLRALQGRIVNIGTAGLLKFRANSYCPAYEISKATLWHLTRTFAKELAHDQITVNMVSPGIMTTSIDKEEKKNLIPMQRLCTPEEVARIVGFLFEEKSHCITGQNIEISGGFGL